MNYFEQIKGFWIAQELNQFGTSEIALYFYLLEVCNKSGWTGTFHRDNSKVMADLSIRSYKTLQSIRDRLSAAGVLSFKQRNGNSNPEYTLHDLGKKYLGTGKGSDPLGKKYQGSGEGLGKGSGKGSGQGPGKVISNTIPDQTRPDGKSLKFKEQLAADQMFFETLALSWKIDAGAYEKMIKDFEAFLKSKNKAHPDYPEYKSHFFNWGARGLKYLTYLAENTDSAYLEQRKKDEERTRRLEKQ